MATRKEVKNRISSVKNVQKITRAMEMVAAARLRRAEQRIDALRPYARELRKMTRQVAEAAGVEARNLPVLQEHEEERTVGILLVTGDRGLAGSFNSQIIRAGVQLQRDLSQQGKEVRFSIVGRRGVSTMRFRGEDLHGEYVGFTDRPAFANAREIAEDLIASYVDKDLNRVDLIYNRYVSPLTQYVRRQTLLPVQQADVFGEGVEELTPDDDAELDDELAEAHRKALWDYEPEPEALLGELHPGVRAAQRLPGAARVDRVGARRADDGDAERRRQRQGGDLGPHPGDEPGAAGGDHPGDPRGRRRR